MAIVRGIGLLPGLIRASESEALVTVALPS